MPRNYDYWKSPAVIWLLKKEKIKDAETFMRQEANKLLRATGQEKPPFSPKRILTLRGIKGIEDADIYNLSELAPIKEGFVIRINPKILPTSINNIKGIIKGSNRSRNFTIAHEIGHTYFYQTDSIIPERPSTDYGSISEERLCDIFASELLMPEDKFREDALRILYQIGNFTETIIKLSSLYDLTLLPVVIRMQELDLSFKGRPIVIKWNWLPNPRIQNKNSTKLRIEWGQPSTYPYIPRYRAAESGSIFEEASKSQDIIYRNTKINIGGLIGVYPVEAIALGKLSTRKTESYPEERNSVLSTIWIDN